ncbi:VIT family protein [Sphingomonas sp. CL5.1]|uniref:VIT1/CCC1 transporter family protein n=1 Tax=Sphingomonas sp. CL5.1 TaxID=2653203 RepID=UPI001581558F|nr:VIT family protein [Sphingomonas sp. CL5.1]QKR99503.1 VIT family protein [Sphingomonas sp. CL5.1]
MRARHGETHAVDRIGWLRAAVLGANDGILSVSSIIVGVAAARPGVAAILLAGLAGLVAGAMSMAAGEFVSVSSQADAEDADRAKEAAELANNPDGEHRELVAIYRARGLDEALAEQVATQLSAHDALTAHLRDELGLTEAAAARPVQAALASAGSFFAGGAAPMLTVLLAPAVTLVWSVPAVALLLLAVLGAIGARAGSASAARGALRVTFWGALAMLVTYVIGDLVGTTL